MRSNLEMDAVLPPMKRESKPAAPVEREVTLMLVAGEPSGDLHGAELIQALKAKSTKLRIIGVGGPRMAAAGQDQLFDLSAHAVLGLAEVLKKFFKFRGFRNRVLALARQERPDAVVLIDCSGFNLRLTPQLRRDLPGSRIIYYVSPQVWASRAGRVEAMQRDIDLLLAILPFEKAWFARVAPKFRVEWVGHPLLDRIRKPENAEANPNLIALLPGSRQTEVAAHLPPMWEAARLMAQERSGLKFILLSPNERIEKFALDLLSRVPAPNFSFEHTTGYATSHLSRSALALVASGTASLECALVGIPQIVVYRVHPLTYAVGRRVIKVNFLSIVNVMANEAIVPEFIQDKLVAADVAKEALVLLGDAKRRETIQRHVAQVVATLGEPGASQRAAQAILREVATPGRN